MGHHDHEDHQTGQTNTVISFSEKADRLLAHWIQHNDDHAHSYRHWADAFREHDLSSVAALLETAAELTQQINVTLDQAAKQVRRTEK